MLRKIWDRGNWNSYKVLLEEWLEGCWRKKERRKRKGGRGRREVKVREYWRKLGRGDGRRENNRNLRGNSGNVIEKWVN